MFHGNRDLPHSLHSNEIPITSYRSLPGTSMSLEISNSPTVAFIDHQRKIEQDSSKLSLPGKTSFMENSYERSPPGGVDNTAVKNSNKDSELNEKCNESHEWFTPLKASSSSSEVGISSVGKNTISDTMACSCFHKSDGVPTGVPESQAPFSSPPDGIPTAPNSTLDLTPYYRFVIFHSPEDHANAHRVCQRLSDLGVVGGTTFSDSFEIPGKSPIACTETAIEKSYYIIILLTEGFANNWTIFQSNTALMNSIQDPEKCATVIPFLPQIGRIVSKLPLCLRTLTALDENSSNFKSKVLNTFKLDEKQKQSLQMTQMMQKLTLESQSNNLNSYTNPGIPHSSSNAPFVMPLTNEAMQGPMFVGGFQQQSAQEANFPVSGQPTIYHINAENVQIGNSNMMTVRMIASDCAEENDGNCENAEQDENAK